MKTAAHGSANTLPQSTLVARVPMESTSSAHGAPPDSHETLAEVRSFLQILRQSAEAEDANSMHEDTGDMISGLVEDLNNGSPIERIARIDIVEALIQLYVKLLKLRVSKRYDDDFQFTMLDCAM